jgi:D-lactate dehydrogenase (cytochrome)
VICEKNLVAKGQDMDQQGRLQPQAIPATVLESLRRLLGPTHVITDPFERTLLSHDFSEIPLATAGVVVEPGSTQEVADVVRLAGAANLPLVPRGGGMSYTLGYVPLRPSSILLDLRRMNRILDIHDEDLYVTVECGVTWAQLFEAMRERTVRMPFFGTLSGLHATVGGSLAQNASGLGYGFLSDCVLGLEVVLADGRVVRTGSGAARGTAPFQRSFGPDLSGLFLADAGAFGIKTRATFGLTRTPGGTAYISCGFHDASTLVAAQCDLARLQIATQCSSLSRSLLAQLAARGLRITENYAHILNVIVDGFDQTVAEHLGTVIRETLVHHRGEPIADTLARLSRQHPFVPIETLLSGPSGECALPTNCFLPLSQARQATAALEAFFQENAADMQQHGITHTCLYMTTGNTFGLQPILYWSDTLSPLRQRFSSPAACAHASQFPSNGGTRAAVIDLRARMITLFRSLGAVHHQIGKLYPYREAFNDTPLWEIVTAFKALLDPRFLLNPGALGLDQVPILLDASEEDRASHISEKNENDLSIWEPGPGRQAWNHGAHSDREAMRARTTPGGAGKSRSASQGTTRVSNPHALSTYESV